MLRVVLENVLLFFLPAALYVAYVMMVRKTNASTTQILNEAPLVLLTVAGVAVIGLTFLFFGAKHEGSPGQAYEPPQYKDGKIVPGRVR